MATLVEFLKRRWFLILLVAALVIGIRWAVPLEALSVARGLRYAVVATVLFLMTLQLEATAIGKAARHPGPPLLGCGLNLCLVPLMAWGVVLVTPTSILDQDTARGLLVAATAPCTLASASVWTRRAGGNEAISLMVTLVTNLCCFVVTPFWLWVMTGESAGVSLTSMIANLGIVVVLPMLLAQLVRLIPAARRLARNRKTAIGVAAQLGILFMVLMGAIQTGIRLRGLPQVPSVFDWAGLIGLIWIIHTVALVFGFWIARKMAVKPSDAKAVAISGSQKTMMVGLQVGMDLGWSIVPMVVYHVSQLVIDTLICDWWRQTDRSGNAG